MLRCPSASCRPSHVVLLGTNQFGLLILLYSCVYCISALLGIDVRSSFVEHRLIADEDEYVKSFNPGLVDVCYAWSSGCSFADICRLTEVFEGLCLIDLSALLPLYIELCPCVVHSGSIIRSLRRLEELLRQMSCASATIGNHELKALFEAGAKQIRRGVVFAASLYL